MYFNVFKCGEGKFLCVLKFLIKCGVGKKIFNNKCVIFFLMFFFFKFFNEMSFCKFFCIFLWFLIFLKIKEILLNLVRILGVLMI